MRCQWSWNFQHESPLETCVHHLLYQLLGCSWNHLYQLTSRVHSFVSLQWGAGDTEIKSHLLRTQSLKVLPLKPGVGQYMAMHAMLTARDFFLANFYPFDPFTGCCFFSKTSPEVFLCWLWLTLVPAWACVGAMFVLSVLKESCFQIFMCSVFRTPHPISSGHPASAVLRCFQWCACL